MEKTNEFIWQLNKNKHNLLSRKYLEGILINNQHKIESD